MTSVCPCKEGAALYSLRAAPPWHYVGDIAASRPSTASFTLGSTDKFGTTILTHLFCPHFGGKSSTEHHSASGFPPRSDEKIYANLADLILSVFPLHPVLLAVSRVLGTVCPLVQWSSVRFSPPISGFSCDPIGGGGRVPFALCHSVRVRL